jgi:hypothetical protein
MKNTPDLKSYLARIADEFDQCLHTSPEDPAFKGWGQFLSPESRQIGLYGTCAGILVKAIGTPDAPIDPGVQSYLVSLWRDRDGKTERYFSQTIRLAFLILALARVQVPALMSIRNAAVRELTDRQRSDGAWGDWGKDAPPRMETTAWAVLALARVDDISATTTARKGASFLQLQVLGYRTIDDSIDPFILGVILQVLSHEPNRRVISAAFQYLGKTRPTDELQIYFVDFSIQSGGTTEMRRDYICVPRFFAFCLIASSSTLRSSVLWFAGARAAISHRRATDHLEKILAEGPLHTSASRSPSTVDQAFVALSVECIANYQSRLIGVIWWTRPILNYLRGNLFVRIGLPLFVLSFFGALAHDPNDIVDLTSWIMGGQTERISVFAGQHHAAIQFTAILIGFLVGKPLLNGIWRFIREKWSL